MRLLAIVAMVLATAHLGWSQEKAMRPGVTVWVYELGEELRELPLLVDGQTPNVSGYYPAVDFSGAWETIYNSSLEQYYLGHAWGNLIVETGGTYTFRLTSDDGAKFYIGDSAALVVDDDPAEEGGRSASLNLLPGTYPFYVDFYQNTGDARVLLEWKPPGAQDFVPIPESSLETEDGLTHVTSPGLKNYYYEEGAGGSAGGPGDGRPLIGVHPGYDLINFRPSDFHPAVGGMDFLPDGRLAICTWDNTGSVYFLDGLDGDSPATVHRFATGLGEPLGLKVIDGVVYVTQKQEVTKLLDTDGDDVADEYLSVAHGWPASFNYHEFSFNLVQKDGYLWVTTSVPLRTGNTAYLPGSEPAFPVPHGPGSLLRIDPQNRTWEIVANGLRTPNGMGVGVDGELFCSDNQGEWLPSSRLNHLVPGNYYGHREDPDVELPYTRPALWLPHGEISNSPAEPILIPSGPYAGQMLIAELTHGGINRAFLEKVKCEYQGAVFQFTQGLECGMNRLVWGPDGSLYAGGVGSGGNWNWNGTTYGLQRLKPNGRTTFEMKSVRARADGIIIEFTQPVPYSCIGSVANYSLQQYHYEPESTYGGPKYNVESLAASYADVSLDRTKVYLNIPGLKEDRVIALRLKNFVNESQVAPWATEAWYTMNQLPEDAGADFTVMDPPPESQIPVSPDVSILYEAESAENIGPVTATEHAGYTGSGYSDYGNAAGQIIRWNIVSTHAGDHQVAFRYANGGTSARPLVLSVNGSVLTTLQFSPTSGWADWVTTNVVVVNLNKGTNTIQLSSAGSTGPNVDSMSLIGPSAAPSSAVVLFDGTAASLLANWKRDQDGARPSWSVEGGALLVNTSPSPNDISTIAGYNDFTLHLEWLSPTGGVDQLGGNSGVKLRRSYEVQILNSAAGIALANDSAGAIYQLKAADLNASLGAGAWQSYDIDFTAARWSGTTKIENAKVTVRWNGVKIHDEVEIPAPTGASLAEASGLQPLLLQAHASDASGPVRFRNIWIIPKDTFSQHWQSWLESQGIAWSTGVEYQDSDHDGLPNLWEYAVDGGATANDDGVSRMPTMKLVEDDEQVYMEFEFVRRADSAAIGLRYSLQTSESLDFGSWTNHPASQIGPAVPIGDGHLERVVLKMDEPVTGLKRIFARLQAELIE
ncbi:DUF1080 domain-containing protein [Luteolibacter pohnpeiensis]|uniref:DUF1080 domain-containing protein n=1 Tax=Luteolibacter pohnpeiensis TaxID=454153 RepID=A0A934VU47_9BACT|nr:family 16 glycoside hydrolase [Luteolibacter pohnpeiensis]MBK1882142.1 DUF1080 domain-containing protein [Luteolibacter pohnpeiensis]